MSRHNLDRLPCSIRPIDLSFYLSFHACLLTNNAACSVNGMLSLWHVLDVPQGLIATVDGAIVAVGNAMLMAGEDVQLDAKQRELQAMWEDRGDHTNRNEYN